MNLDKFSLDNFAIDFSGTPSLTGNASTGEVVNGKTFYNTSLTKQTGTGSNAKRTSNGSSSATSLSLSSLVFTPSRVIISGHAYHASNGWYDWVAVISSSTELYADNTTRKAIMSFRYVISGGSEVSGDETNSYVQASGFYHLIPNSASASSISWLWWAYE